MQVQIIDGGLAGHTFDGTNYLSMTSGNFGSFDRTKFAFACNFQVDEDAASSQALFSYDVSGSPSRIVAETANTGTFRVRFVFLSSGTTYVYQTGAELNVGDTVSVLFHYDGGTMSCWINGSSDTPNSTQGSGTVSAATGNFNYGRRADDTSYFTGVIEMPAFFSGSLPSTGDIFSGDFVKSDLSAVTGLWSYLDEVTVTSDAVLVADWTNNNDVTL